MNMEYQRIIDKLKDRFKRTVDLSKLRPELEERNIAIVSNDPDEFYDSLCSRDPYAFLTLIEALSENGYAEESNLLLDECSNSYTPFTYKMSSKPVGLCLIINNIDFKESRNRKESNIDVPALQRLFKFLGFKVSVEQNLTAQEMTNCLEELSRNKELERVDSIVVFILTHGGRHDEKNVDILLGIDEEKVVLKSVYETFNHNNCEMLVGKPKMFFFQACRGNEEDQGRFIKYSDLYTDLADTDIRSFKTRDCSSFTLVHVPSLTDTIVVHSTMPCHSSITDSHQGSWLCQELVPVFMAGSRHDLFTMLSTVSKGMEKRSSTDKCKQAVHVELFGVTGIVKFPLGSNASVEAVPSQLLLTGKFGTQGNVEGLFPFFRWAEKYFYKRIVEQALFIRFAWHYDYLSADKCYFQSIAREFFLFRSQDIYFFQIIVWQCSPQEIAEHSIYLMSIEQQFFRDILKQDFLKSSDRVFFESLKETYNSDRIEEQSSIQKIAEQSCSQMFSGPSHTERIT